MSDTEIDLDATGDPDAHSMTFTWAPSMCMGWRRDWSRPGLATVLLWGALHLPFTVSPGTHYYFGVAVWDYYQTDAPWAVVTLSATSTGTSDPLPASPAFAHAVYDPSVVRGQVKLAWANSSSDETNFKIYRSDNGGAYQLIKTTGADETHVYR